MRNVKTHVSVQSLKTVTPAACRGIHSTLTQMAGCHLLNHSHHFLQLLGGPWRYPMQYGLLNLWQSTGLQLEQYCYKQLFLSGNAEKLIISKGHYRVKFVHRVVFWMKTEMNRIVLPWLISVNKWVFKKQTDIPWSDWNKSQNQSGWKRPEIIESVLWHNATTSAGAWHKVPRPGIP